jgi:hypothetical protein
MGRRVGIAGRIEMKFTASGDLWGWRKLRQYWQTRPLLISVLFVVAFVSPFLGFFGVDGWLGVGVNLALNAITFVGSFYAGMLVREEIRSR